MLDAKHELRRLLRSHRQGSHAVQEARRDTVQAFVKALDENGFSRAVRQSGFKIKEAHVRRAVGVWRASGTACSTIEKRLGHLRFMARAQGRPGVMRENKAYLPGYKRERQARETKAIDPARVDPDKCRSTYAAASVSLQKEFGVRRKEAILVQPWRSERKDGQPATHLVLHGDCTKGGRPRSIPIRTEAQRVGLRTGAGDGGGRFALPAPDAPMAARRGGSTSTAGKRSGRVCRTGRRTCSGRRMPNGVTRKRPDRKRRPRAVRGGRRWTGKRAPPTARLGTR